MMTGMMATTTQGFVKSDNGGGSNNSSSGTKSTPPAGAGTPGFLVFDGFQLRSVKRPRPVKSCTECRSRKLRCDRLSPCSQCTKSHRPCRYATDQSGNGNASDSSEGEEASSDRPAQKRVAMGVTASKSATGSSTTAGRHQSSPRQSQFQPQLLPQPKPLPRSQLPSMPPNALTNDAVAASNSSVDASNYYKAGFEDISSRLERLEKLIIARSGSSTPVHCPVPNAAPTLARPPEWSSTTGAHSNNINNNNNHHNNRSNTITSSTSGRSSNYSSSSNSARTITRSNSNNHSDTNTTNTTNTNSSGIGIGIGDGGNNIPRLVTTSPMTMRGLTIKGSRSLRTRFFGQNSTRVLLNLFDEAKDFMYNKAKRESARELFSQLQAVYPRLQEEQIKSLAPITVFVDSMMPVLKRMTDILPRKSVCDKLLDAYVGTSEGLYRVVHVPTFRAEYEGYWEGKRCSEGFLAQLLCMLSIGSRFETESRGLGRDRSEGVHVPTACALVRVWLDGLRGKQLVHVGTLLAEVLLLHAQRMIAPRPQDSWTQLGLIVRMATTMGLHRDPSEFPQIPPFAAESRRKLWYTIMDMDLHVSLGCNLPCAVRDGEYTCQPPRNLEDEDLWPDMRALPPARAIDVRTDGQLQAYAASTLPIRMRAAALVSRLDSIRDYGEVLEIGTRLERILDDINCLFPRNQSLDPRGKYKEWRMRALLDMHIRRPLLALYRPFALSTPDCPAQITSTYLKSSMVLLTYMDELDSRTPGFADVNHMYHIILKHDIIQAAFSVCYYIRNAHDGWGNNPSGGNGGGGDSSSIGTPAHTPGAWTTALSPESSSDGGGGVGLGSNYNHNSSSSSNNSFQPPVTDAGRPIWSVERMTRVVEKTLEDLILFIRDSTSDLKDIIALSIVIKSVQPGGTADQRVESIKGGIRRILDACLATLGKSGQEGLVQNSAFTPTPNQMDNRTPLPEPTYTPSVLPFEMATAGFAEYHPLWDMEFWTGWQPEPV